MTASPDRYVSTRDRAAPTGAPLQVPSLDPTVVAPCQVPSLDLAIDAHAGVPTVVGADTTDAREAQPQSATVDLGTRRRRSQARRGGDKRGHQAHDEHQGEQQRGGGHLASLAP